MAIKLPKSSGGRKNPFAGLMDKIGQFTDKMPYHYWIIASGLVSLLLGAIVFTTLDDSSDKNAEKEPPVSLVKVVAAKQDINPRAIIKDEMLKMVEVPENSVPDGAIKDMAEIRNLPASVTIYSGDIITKKKVLSNPRMAGFTGTIPPDCRAMSIAISDVTGVAGFAKAGDYVDIMLVTESKDGGKITSSVVLQNVLLLGVNKSGSSAESDSNGKNTKSSDSGKDTSKDNKDGKDSKDKNKDSGEGNINAAKDAMATATLAVTPTQSLQLIAAAKKGILYMVLRPFKPRDNYTFSTEYTTYVDLDKKTESAPAPAPAPQQRVTPPAPQPPVRQPATAVPQQPAGGVEVFRGVDKTREGR